MKYKIRTTNQFNKDLKRCQKRNLPMEKLRKVISMLADDDSLPAEYKPHKLVGVKGDNTWECHIQPDWLLVWQQFDKELIMLMVSTGSHSDLF